MKNQNETSVEASRDQQAQSGALGVATGSVSDSRLAYIVCHLASLAKNLAVFGGIVWLAYALQSGWVLWALLLCPWTRYKHDFGCSSQNNRI